MQQLIKCYKCGEQNSLGNRFCIRCGEPFHYKCPQCNATISPEFTTCPNCNVTLDWGIKQDDKPETTAVTEKPVDDVKSETKAIRREQRVQRRKATPWIIGFIIIVICIAVAFAVDSFLQGKSDPVSQQTPAATQEETALDITAEKLSGDYAADEIAADRLYKGNILKVTGKINSVNKNLMGVYFVKLSGGSIEAWEIQCTFDEEYSSDVAQLEPNDRVTISGTCDGYYMSIKMKDCILVQ